MKYILLLSLIILSAQKTDLQKIRTNNLIETLNGRVIKVVEFHYSKNQATPYPESDTTIYNKSGLVIEFRVGTGLGGSTISKYDYSDNTSYPAKTTETAYFDNKVLKGGYLNKYDDSKNLVESSNYLKNGDGLNKTLFKYDRNMNLIESISYDTKGKLVNKGIYNYDSRNFLIEENNFNENADLNHTVNFIYQAFDEKGNWIKRQEVWRFKRDINQHTTERKITYY